MAKLNVFFLGLMALAGTIYAVPTENSAYCPTNGAMQCCGTGFVTCANNEWVYRDCGPGTTCYAQPNGGLYCGYPASLY